MEALSKKVKFELCCDTCETSCETAQPCSECGKRLCSYHSHCFDDCPVSCDRCRSGCNRCIKRGKHLCDERLYNCSLCIHSYLSNDPIEPPGAFCRNCLFYCDLCKSFVCEKHDVTHRLRCANSTEPRRIPLCPYRYCIQSLDAYDHCYKHCNGSGVDCHKLPVLQVRADMEKWFSLQPNHCHDQTASHHVWATLSKEAYEVHKSLLFPVNMVLPVKDGHKFAMPEISTEPKVFRAQHSVWMEDCTKPPEKWRLRWCWKKVGSCDRCNSKELYYTLFELFDTVPSKRRIRVHWFYLCRNGHILMKLYVY